MIRPARRALIARRVTREGGMQTVRRWLEQLGLPQYEEVVADDEVDLDTSARCEAPGQPDLLQICIDWLVAVLPTHRPTAFGLEFTQTAFG